MEYDVNKLVYFIHSININFTSSEKENLANRIIKIAKFVNRKYPDMDVVGKLSNNLLRYGYEKKENSITYISYLKEISDKLHSSNNNDYDILLKLINNDKYINILFALISIKDSIYIESYNDFNFIIDKLPYFPEELINKISFDLHINKIYFLLHLVIKKDINIKITYDEINSQNYPDVIREVIGDNGVEIKLFELIYPYFDTIPHMEWINLYYILIKYKDINNIVEYFSRAIVSNIRYINTKYTINGRKLEMNLFIKRMNGLINFSDGDLLLYHITNNLPIFEFFYDYYDSEFLSCEDFFIKKIVPTGIDIFDLGLEYNKIGGYIEEVVAELYRLCRKSETFTEKLIKKIFIKGQNKYHIFLELLNYYNYLFEYISNENFYSNSELENFLVSLLDKEIFDIVAYNNLFSNLHDITIFYLSHNNLSKDTYPFFRIDGEDITYEGGYFDYKNYENSKKRIVAYLLMFIIRKNDIKRSTNFVNKFKKIIKHCIINHMPIDDNFIEFVYSNSEKTIKNIVNL